MPIPWGKKIFKSSGTFTFPSGVTDAIVKKAIAGGGGGATDVGGDGGGGGEGGQEDGDLDVASADGSLSITIGNGGAPGADGEDTIIEQGGSPILTVLGGRGATSSTGAGDGSRGGRGGLGQYGRGGGGGGGGGVGGSADGDDAASPTNGLLGHGGVGEKPAGDGGKGGDFDQDGYDGLVAGGGGGGGATDHAGGAGAKGRVEIEWGEKAPGHTRFTSICCCDPRPSCSDCHIPFVNEAHTKTRYPLRALITLSGINYDDYLHPGAVDCGFCGCMNGMWLANLQGYLTGNWFWGYPSTRPTDTLFSFVGGASSCSENTLLDGDVCPDYSTSFIGEFNECTSIDGLTRYSPSQLSARIESSGGFNYLVVHYNWTTWRGDTNGFTVQGLLPDYFSLTNDCGTGDAMVLPDSVELVEDAFTINPAGDYAGEQCTFAGGTIGSVAFSDWVERDFPVPV